MAIDLYYLPGSAPCSAVQMTAKAIGVDLNLKFLDLFKGEHLTPEFIKINPQHVVPTLVDHATGLSLWESRAIITYLVDKYAKDDTLYPRDPVKRAMINQRLYFDMGVLYQRLMEKYYTVWFEKFHGRVFPKADESLREAVEFLNTFLDGQNYVANNTYSVADISLLASISALEAAGFDLSPFANVVAWYDRAKKNTVAYSINEEHIEAFKKFKK